MALSRVRKLGTCNTFWGSHGCDKEKGHVDAGDPIHVCGSDDGTAESLCSEHDGTCVRFWLWDGDDIMSLGDPIEYPVFFQ